MSSWQIDARCWVILNILDTVTTLQARGDEFNPILNWLALTPQALVIHKIGWTALVLLFLYIIGKIHLLKPLNIMWLIIIAVNLLAIITNVAIDKISGK